MRRALQGLGGFIFQSRPRVLLHFAGYCRSLPDGIVGGVTRGWGPTAARSAGKQDSKGKIQSRL